MRNPNQKPVRKQASVADITDSFMRKTALGVLLTTLAYALSVVMYLVPDPLADLLDKIQLGLALLIVIVVFPAFVGMVRLRHRQKSDCAESDSFIVSMFGKASAKAFSLTFLFLVFMQLVTEKFQTDLPAEFFVNAIIAFSLGVFSIRFFLLVRGDENEDDLDQERQS